MVNVQVLFILITIWTNICSIRAVCQNTIENKVNPEDINIIVNKHNHLRSLISDGKISDQPKGINLNALKWDSVLADQAQKIANTCIFRHVKVNDHRWPVGQNLAISWSNNRQMGRADWNGIIQSWFDEHKNFRYPSTSYGDTGHYTQVVWSSTQYVGCGYTFWSNNGWFKKLYVCNYGPAGNYIGQPPYKTSGGGGGGKGEGGEGVVYDHDQEKRYPHQDPLLQLFFNSILPHYYTLRDRLTDLRNQDFFGCKEEFFK